MCGIFGAIGRGFDPRWGEEALATLAHRGPDGAGTHWDARRGLFLGHRRLSIIDLSDAARQPMTNEDGSLHLTFNGEIYNFAALRADLVSKGHAFRSRCDAEVILHLYEEKGIELLADLHGMFAFALHDAKRETLFLARDRLGIKPLHYYQDEQLFCFASELKALAAVPGLDLSPDVTAYYDFLTYRFVPAPKTVYARAKKLPAAHVLELSAAGTRVTRYWDLPGETREIGAERALEELTALLETAVAEHLVADVEVGTFLSAGVDSSLVTALATRVGGHAPRAFTISFPGRRNDEAVEAARLAAALGAQHRVVRYERGEEAVGEMHALFDEPFADQSALPLLELARMASEDVKVVLSGDGGDESHAGYGRYRKHLRRDRAYGILARVPWKRLPDGVLRALFSAPWGRDLVEEPVGWRHNFHAGIPRQAKRMMISFAGREFDDYDDYWLIREHTRAGLGALARRQYLDLVTLLPEGGLTKVDRTSMRHGLEVRPPLLDHRLVSFAFALPDALKQSASEGKLLLRALLARVLPAYDASTPKMGFSLPLKRLVAEQGLFRLTKDIEVFDAFRIDRRSVERVLSPRRNSHELWMLFVLSQFLSHRETQGLALSAS